MSAISQLDGTCSANCCNADGASDEPCESCKLARPTSDLTPEQKKGFDVTGIKLYEPDQQPEVETMTEPVVTSVEEPFIFNGDAAEHSARKPSEEPVPIPTAARGLSGEPPAKKAKVTPKKAAPGRTNTETSTEPAVDTMEE